MKQTAIENSNILLSTFKEEHKINHVFLLQNAIPSLFLPF
jgi:hypothetical protein